jgi:iron complex transport system ATP-binding protein
MIAAIPRRLAIFGLALGCARKPRRARYELPCTHPRRALAGKRLLGCGYSGTCHPSACAGAGAGGFGGEWRGQINPFAADLPVSPPQAGRILLDGADIHTLSARRVAQRVAAVLQEQPTDFALSVAEIVALGRAPHRRALAGPSAHDRHVVDHALERMSLSDFAHRQFGTLSGGERQRVMVARALAQEPGLIVLDEPTNHLDIRHQLEVLHLVRGLGATVVASLHDLNLVHGFADDLLVLSSGRPLAFGPVAEVLTPALIAEAFGVIATPRGARHFDFSLPPALETETN